MPKYEQNRIDLWKLFTNISIYSSIIWYIFRCDFKIYKKICMYNNRMLKHLDMLTINKQGDFDMSATDWTTLYLSSILIMSKVAKFWNF